MGVCSVGNNGGYPMFHNCFTNCDRRASTVEWKNNAINLDFNKQTSRQTH